MHNRWVYNLWREKNDMSLKYKILKIISKNGVSQNRKILATNKSKYFYDRRDKAYIKNTRTEAVYRYFFIGTDEDPDDYDTWTNGIKAYTTETGIVMSPKVLLEYFRKKVYFPLDLIKDGSIRGVESMIIIRGHAHWGRKGEARYKILKRYRKEYNGGLPEEKDYRRW